jgi:methylated-DNA-[protein]-cysteine S-methyltransferase
VVLSDPASYDAILETPLGMIGIVTSGGALCVLDFVTETIPPTVKGGAVAAEVVRQLQRYFATREAGFTLPLQLSGTEFQRTVWERLRAIPPGSTRTYGEIAHELNSSPRAVGNACRANPVPIVIPCHRVVAVGGIGGYAGATSGRRLAIKRWLLEHEGVGR